MVNINHNLTVTEKRKRRVRSKLHGTSLRPRLTVNKSNKHTYLQVIDDDKGVTIIAASDAKIRKALNKVNSKAREGALGQKGSEMTKTASAIKATEELLSAMKKAKVKAVVFDRGQYKYHGRVKAVAEKLRESGIEV